MTEAMYPAGMMYGTPPGGFGPPPGVPPGHVPPPHHGGAPHGMPPHAGQTQEPLGLWSLICGIGSLVVGCCCAFVGVPLAIGAIVLGVISIGKIDKQPELYKGKELAYVGIGLGALGVIGLIVSFALGFGSYLLDQLGVRP